MGAFFICDAMQKVSYKKPWLNIDDQLSKLESRNLLVSNKESAKRFLRYFNYYRFAGYALKFQEWDNVWIPSRFDSLRYLHIWVSQ